MTTGRPNERIYARESREGVQTNARGVFRGGQI
jgi:hypothetical protein